MTAASRPRQKRIKRAPRHAVAGSRAERRALAARLPSLGPRQRPRTCVGCRAEATRAELVRLVLGPEERVLPDLAGGSFGRGAWVHPRPACIAAAPRGLSRSFSVGVRSSAEDVAQALRDAGARRAIGLLVAARRAGKLAIGSTAVREALAGGGVRLVIVATDAAAAAATPALLGAVSAGLAVAWGTKAEHGARFGRDEIAVLALDDEGLAVQLRAALDLSRLPTVASQVHPTPTSERAERPEEIALGASQEDG